MLGAVGLTGKRVHAARVPLDPLGINVAHHVGEAGAILRTLLSQDLAAWQGFVLWFEVDFGIFIARLLRG